MKVLIAPDSFKGSLTATEVSKEIHKAVKEAVILGMKSTQVP